MQYSKSFVCPRPPVSLWCWCALIILQYFWGFLSVFHLLNFLEIDRYLAAVVYNSWYYDSMASVGNQELFPKYSYQLTASEIWHKNHGNFDGNILYCLSNALHGTEYKISCGVCVCVCVCVCAPARVLGPNISKTARDRGSVPMGHQ